jgi:hypothetical protein
MRLVRLAWYVCGISVFGGLLATAITFAPGAEWRLNVILSIWGFLALASAGAALVLGRLPPTHAIHQSRPAWAGAVAIALTATLFLALVG